ncbi:DoxX family protein [Sorangium sp. So ce1078]|uniref:DoxX family protein n=1 Tax=Sorangium sp. So ce1078 TaxID=3133329 RepID=UPI003F5F4070
MTAIVASIQHRVQDLMTGPQTGTPTSVAAPGAAPSRRALWAGRVLSGLGVLFLTFDAAVKVLRLFPAEAATGQLGFPASLVPTLGYLQIACLVTYLIPRTAVLGAILWTGYLGGAIAIHVRVGSPLFSHTLFPIYIAALLWAGLWLRDRRARALLASPASLDR